MSDHSKLRRRIPLIAFIICTLMGVAMGLFRTNIVSGVLVGTGSGFVLLAILNFVFRNKKQAEKKEDASPVDE